MSGRIRTIKPELLEDAVTAGLSHVAFRLFIGCILLADDYGNLRFEMPWLRGQVFWAREVSLEEFAAAIEELTVAQAGDSEALVQPYVVKGQRYAAIRGWSKHQRVQKPGRPRVPGRPPENDDKLAIPTSRESGESLSGDPPEDLRTDLRSPISDHEVDLDRESPARAHTREVASLGVETDQTYGHAPAPVPQLVLTLETPLPPAWRQHAEGIVRRMSVDFGIDTTWAMYRGDRIKRRLHASEPDWVVWAEREARSAAERNGRLDDVGWGKVRGNAMRELPPDAPPYCAPTKLAETPDYDRATAVGAAAALAAGNFGPPVRKAGS